MDCKCVIKSPFTSGKVIVYIGNFPIADRLDISVLRSCDRKSATVEQVVSLRFRVALFIYQIFYNLLDQGIYKIAVWFACPPSIGCRLWNVP